MLMNGKWVSPMMSVGVNRGVGSTGFDTSLWYCLRCSSMHFLKMSSDLIFASRFFCLLKTSSDQRHAEISEVLPDLAFGETAMPLV
jgi:hypothetical protein